MGSGSASVCVFAQRSCALEERQPSTPSLLRLPHPKEVASNMGLRLCEVCERAGDLRPILWKTLPLEACRRCRKRWVMLEREGYTPYALA